MNRPKQLDSRYGWCKKHGVILPDTAGCSTCRKEAERKKNGLCCALLYHGPGHQSRTYCSVKGKHTIHSCVYGSYGQYAEWTGKDKCTGYFDEPPSI